MDRTRTHKSDVKAAIHETRLDLHVAGLIDKNMMRRFDDSCLTPVRKFTAEEIRALREREQVSQTMFALYLHVTRDSIDDVMGFRD
jgi:putative transcriptional regulator